ncbi:zinc ABC transporter substrate-binding protein [Skermanella rosea]|uniref:metal ABC transporter solute-binding protein, Zn/Mn family n=1 Tax=Skermanella rosea TaxID=1817965 RepID=UPI001932F72F|nr:zinc ABC transporter substrate-binding protein [Skermanella rosea]UEM03223.1 zinc ABC transporter substrate-binding protein [Skermanella rosea]
MALVSRRLFVLAILCLALYPITSPGTARAAGQPFAAVATTSQVADLVREVAGGRAEVSSLMGEGVDPHTYKLTRSDVARIAGADIVFYSGLHLEGKIIDALTRVAGSGKPVQAVAEAVPADRLLTPEGFDGNPDPHVWMDVALWTHALNSVREALAAFDPEGADIYRANAADLSRRFERLDAYARSVLGGIPEQARVLVTAHDAFNYLGRAYGLEVRGIQGISTESEAGLREIEDLVDLLVTRRIAAVFVETSVSERNIRALIDGAAARGHQVVIGGALYSDAMGAPGTYEGTYVGMIDHNVTTIARALGGTPPAGGFEGRLAALER